MCCRLRPAIPLLVVEVLFRPAFLYLFILQALVPPYARHPPTVSHLASFDFLIYFVDVFPIVVREHCIPGHKLPTLITALVSPHCSQPLLSFPDTNPFLVHLFGHALSVCRSSFHRLTPTPGGMFLWTLHDIVLLIVRTVPRSLAVPTR